MLSHTTLTSTQDTTEAENIYITEIVVVVNAMVKQTNKQTNKHTKTAQVIHSENFGFMWTLD